MITDFEELFQKSSKNIRQDLKIMQEAYRKLALDKVESKNFLIAGTNGKGTTSGFLWSMLSASGLKVGLYTSPHIFDFRERIKCSHKNITDLLLVSYLHELKSKLGSNLYGSLTFFEVSTLLAFLIFKDFETDINVIEVGLGGRLDATNVIQPVASCVVSISFDHEKWLGSSLQEIALEKLGIVRKKTPLFWGMEASEEYSKVIQSVLIKTVKEQELILYQAGESFGLNNDTVFSKFSKGKDRQFNPPPFFYKQPKILKKNFSLANAMFDWFKTQYSSYFSKSIDSAENLYNFSFWPSSLRFRFQKVNLILANNKKCEFIFDCCHNLAALNVCYHSLVEKGYLKSNSKIPVVAAFLNDKDYLSLLEKVSTFADPLYIIGSSSERSLSIKHLQGTRYQKYYFHNFSTLWSKVLCNDESLNKTILFCGSIIGISEILAFFRVNVDEQHFNQDLNIYSSL